MRSTLSNYNPVSSPFGHTSLVYDALKMVACLKSLLACPLPVVNRGWWSLNDGLGMWSDRGWMWGTEDTGGLWQQSGLKLVGHIGMLLGEVFGDSGLAQTPVWVAATDGAVHGPSRRMRD